MGRARDACRARLSLRPNLERHERIPSKPVYLESGSKRLLSEI